MLDKTFIYKSVLPLIKEKSRMLEYYMIQSLFENKDNEIIEELLKFQNEDGGFGHGLEPDVQMPYSSVLATNVAIKALACVKDVLLKEDIVKGIVHYFEDVYNEKKNRFSMSEDSRLDDYPHAVWWNFNKLDENFPFGNPDPEVIGFLHANKKHMRKLEINKHIDDVITFVMSDRFLESSMHTLLSTMTFYKLVDKNAKAKIRERIQLLVDKEITEGIGKWDEYSLEPYKIYVIESSFLESHKDVLKENLYRVESKVSHLDVMPNWKWYQYDEVFEIVKNDWIGHMYHEMILALKIHEKT